MVDDPTAGISADNAISIFSNIKQHNPNITILMATHLLDFESVVDKVKPEYKCFAVCLLFVILVKCFFETSFVSRAFQKKRSKVFDFLSLV